MSHLVRKIARAKWGRDGGVDTITSADAITSCLRTTSNELSVWVINELTEIEDAILAIISPLDKCDTIDVVTFSIDHLSEQGLKIKTSSGRTRYNDFKDRHRDICELNYISLGSVANLVREAINNGHYERIHRKRLKAILNKGIEDGKINASELSSDLREELSKGA